MIITETEFEKNLDRYLDLAQDQDITITRNGREIARLTSPVVDRLETLDHLVGMIPKDFELDEDALREERLSRQ